MTNQEALQAICPISVSSNLFQKVLLDNSITPGDNYIASTDKRNLDLSLADLLEYVVLNPDYSEGDLNVTIDREELKRRVTEIRKKYGVSVGIIRAVKKW